MSEVKMIPTYINDRWVLILPEHRHDRPEWPWWEATRLAAMYHFIGEGDVVYDIGAEEGDFPALFAKWGAQVVLVEPNPLVWPNIKAIFDANELSHMVIGSFVGFASDTNAEPTGDGLSCVGGAEDIQVRHGAQAGQMLDGLVEQLLVESKRTRDTETAAMNMQLVAWRDRAAVNQAFVAGAGDALRTWRQP